MTKNVLTVLLAVCAAQGLGHLNAQACVTVAPQLIIEGVKDVRLGRPGEAIMKFNGGLADVYNNRGEAYAQAGRWHEALADYNMSISLNPGDSRPHAGLAAYFMMKGQYDQAIQEYRKAVAIRDSFSLWSVPQLAWIHFMRGDEDLAFKDYNLLVNLMPQEVHFRTMRGMVAYEKKDFDHALADFNQLLVLNPNMPSALLGRSLVYAAKGEADLARQDLSRLRSSNSPLAAQCLAWAQMFESRGLRPKAREYLGYALMIRPELKIKYADFAKSLS